jgi:Asp-tRNA(Asn)/Glu-tRNA(Gln) amidotransferase A subunit family amidase
MRSSRERLEEALARIADPKGEGVRTCLAVHTQAARDAADASDARSRSKISLSPLMVRYHQGSFRCCRRANPCRVQSAC